MDSIDWQTLYYVITSAVMLVLLVFLIAVTSLVLKIRQSIEMGFRNFRVMRSLFKIGALRSLLKLLR